MTEAEINGGMDRADVSLLKPLKNKALTPLKCASVNVIRTARLLG